MYVYIHMQSEQHQGNLQGALSSLRTLATGIGALTFGLIFSFSVSDIDPSAPWLAFMIGSLLYFLGWGYCYWLFSSSGWVGGSVSHDKRGALLSAVDDDNNTTRDSDTNGIE